MPIPVSYTHLAGDDQPYAFFFVTAETDSHYTVQLGGKVSRYLCRYDEKENQMDKSYGSSSSICEVTFDLSAGETTYLVAALNETKKAVSLTCKAKGTEIEKEEAKSVEVAIGDLVAGSKFPEADASKMTNYSIKSATWYGDADEDNNVDFATAHRLKLVLAPSVGVAFTENTQVYFNGTLVTEKEIGSNGMLTIYHTFPYTDCKITFPEISGYTIHTEGMTAVSYTHLHTTTEKEYYAFSPQTSGWYDLCMTDDSTNTFTSGIYETIYYTTDNGEKTEHTKEYYQYQKNSDSHSEHLMWLNQEEVYVFYCVPAAYEDPDTIDIAPVSYTHLDVYKRQGATAVMAQKQPVTKEKIYEKLNKTGNTPFVFESLESNMEENIFLSIGAVNELRRQALEPVSYTHLELFMNHAQM